MVVNPFWPDQWVQVGAELFNLVVAPPVLDPAGFRGAEWLSLTGKDLLRLAGVPIVLWQILILRQLGRQQKLEAKDAFGVILSICFLAAAMIMAKFCASSDSCMLRKRAPLSQR